MKKILSALAFAGAFTLSQNASALIISAQLDSFQSTPVSVSGVGSGGGRGSFTMIGADAVVPDNLASILQGSFEGMCLEPNEFISTGVTYNFAVVDLRFAPTAAGGMGQAREEQLESIFEQLGLTSVESLDLLQMYIVTGLTYEAGFENPGNSLDLLTGTAVITGTGTAQAQTALNAVAGAAAYDVQAYALLNLGIAGQPETRLAFRGQDFMVLTAEAVPSPGPLALMGLGMLGLVGLRKTRTV